LSAWVDRSEADKTSSRENNVHEFGGLVILLITWRLFSLRTRLPLRLKTVCLSSTRWFSFRWEGGRGRGRCTSSNVLGADAHLFSLGLFLLLQIVTYYIFNT
jgi:hypothetical protein